MEAPYADRPEVAMHRRAGGADWVRFVVVMMAVVIAAALVVGLLLAFTVSPALAGDRIDDMRASGELDCYRASVRAAGAYYRDQGVPLTEIPILWRERPPTEQERRFVAAELRAGYTMTDDAGVPVSAIRIMHGVVCGTR